MEEVFEFLKNVKTYFLSTMNGNEITTRPFGTIDVFEGHLTFQTGKVKEVSKQIHQNPNVSICAFDGKTWLRISAKAFELDSYEARVHMLDTHPNLQKMYKADDGNTEVFELKDVTARFCSFTEPERVVKF